MNVRKLMARLNASTVRFDAGRGGMPELTPQDIAGALGMVEERLGVELLSLTYWPDGARISKSELFDTLLIALLKEFSRRQEERAMRAMRHLLHGERFRMDKGWPRIGPIYPALVRAVLQERIKPKTCPTCQGREYVAVGESQKLCLMCNGFGEVQVSERQRAKALGMHHKTFSEGWSEPYQWLFQFCADKESRAADQVVDQLKAEVI